MKLHKIIEIYLKYDNMHKNRIFNALNDINNHSNLCTNCMLSITINHIGSSSQLANTLTNRLSITSYYLASHKLGFFYLHALT